MPLHPLILTVTVIFATVIVCALLLTSNVRTERGLGAWLAAAAVALLARDIAPTAVYALAFMLVIGGAAVLAAAPTLRFPSIILSSRDVADIQGLLQRLPPQEREAANDLAGELARADVVPPQEVPPDVVTMHSRVVYEHVDNGDRGEGVLVFPDEADASEQRISILSPVGSALIGLRVGQAIDWSLPNGRHARLRVLQTTSPVSLR